MALANTTRQDRGIVVIIHEFLLSFRESASQPVSEDRFMGAVGIVAIEPATLLYGG